MMGPKQRRVVWLTASHWALGVGGAVLWQYRGQAGVAGTAAGALLLALLAVLASRAHARAFAAPFSRICHALARLGPQNLVGRLTASGSDAAEGRVVEEINGLLGRLEPSFGEMGEYAAHVAHELRTPLHVIRAKLEAGGAKIDPEFSDQLQDELARLTHVIDQTLLIAKAERGRLTLRLERLDLRGELGMVFDDFDLLFEARRRRLAWKVDPNLMVYADRRHLRQLTHNLLSNALLHGAGDAVVRGRIGRDGARQILIVNPVGAHGDGGRALNLGLGMRVVRSLVGAQPGASMRRHAGRRWHAVLLSFPEASTGGGSSPTRPVASDSRSGEGFAPAPAPAV